MAKDKNRHHQKKITWVVALLITGQIAFSQSIVWKTSTLDFSQAENSLLDVDSLQMIHHEGSWFKRKLFLEHFITYTDTNLYLFLDPVLDLRLSADDKGKYYQNTRGIRLFANYADRILMQSEFYETQTTFPVFIKNWLDTFKIIPGAVQYKPFKENGYDFGVAYSRLMVRFSESISSYFAYDKLDLSPGYFNLWINSTSMPFPQAGLIIKKKKWYWHYDLGTLYNPDFTGRMYVPVVEGRNAFQKKWFSFNHIRVSPWSAFDVYLFESMILPPQDLGSKARKYGYLLPLPWFRQFWANDTLFGKFSGVGWQMKIQRFRFYNTYMFAEKGRGVASQAGVCFLNRLKNKPGFNVLMEYSQANGLAYASDHVWTGWHHMDFPLGHPLGKRFKQLFLVSDITHGRWFSVFEANVIQQRVGERSSMFHLQDVPDTLHERYISLKIYVGYLINPASGLSVFVLPWWHGQWENGQFNSSIWLQFGISYQVRPYWFNFW